MDMRTLSERCWGIGFAAIWSTGAAIPCASAIAEHPTSSAAETKPVGSVRKPTGFVSKTAKSTESYLVCLKNTPTYWGGHRDSLNPKYAQPKKNPFGLIYSLN